MKLSAGSNEFGNCLVKLLFCGASVTIAFYILASQISTNLTRNNLSGEKFKKINENRRCAK